MILKLTFYWLSEVSTEERRIGRYHPGLLSGVTGEDVARWELGLGGEFF